MDITQKITQELGIKPWQAEAVITLIDEGNTIPFIARYRKEATGALDDEMLRNFDERLKYLRSLEERKQTVISSIESDKLNLSLKYSAVCLNVKCVISSFKSLGGVYPLLFKKSISICSHTHIESTSVPSRSKIAALIVFKISPHDKYI